MKPVYLFLLVAVAVLIYFTYGTKENMTGYNPPMLGQPCVQMRDDCPLGTSCRLNKRCPGCRINLNDRSCQKVDSKENYDSPCAMQCETDCKSKCNSPQGSKCNVDSDCSGGQKCRMYIPDPIPGNPNAPRVTLQKYCQ